ncbi:MAG: hypothetical protein JKX73_08555 [Flavobacteriales bacterium]|nr:hypothetical protein [Flavobacteriales bacterium]
MKLFYGLLICSFIGLQSCGHGAFHEHGEHVCTEKCTEGTQTCGVHCGCGDACECTAGNTCSDACDVHDE